MIRAALSVLVLVVALLAPAPARSAGGHGSIGCVACHGLKKVQGTSSFCLQCHSEKEKGGRGIRPISKHASHPFDLPTVNPRVARIPAELARPDGSFGCLSCHDPHPANSNYAYLRVGTGPKGGDMEPFCAVCHPRKSDRAPGAIGAPSHG
ncbi:MAG TPA: cytochrome c3 family protein [Anaeromyxobacter sp.]